MHCVFAAQHTYATDFFWKLWHVSIETCILHFFRDKYKRKPSELARPYFYHVKNKGLISKILAACRINFFGTGIYAASRFCNMYRVFVWTNGKFSWNFFLKSVDTQSIIFEWIWIIRHLQTHCKFLEFTIQAMPFKTQFTSMVDTRGLTDSASLKTLLITAETVEDIFDLKLVLVGVCFCSRQHVQIMPLWFASGMIC